MCISKETQPNIIKHKLISEGLCSLKWDLNLQQQYNQF